MLKRFVFDQEDRPGAAWAARFDAGRDAALQWYCGQGLAPPPTAAECRAALARHMPELLEPYDRACTLVGDDEIAHCILSHYRPPPVRHGCSQAVWLGPDGPALVRNYDFPPQIATGRFELTCWSGRRVIATAQRPWGGCYDGMNEDGLAASMTYGGSDAQGLGFSILLLMRYVLETCTTVADGIEALRGIPVALSQNVTLLDRTGAYATLFIGPGRDCAVSRDPVCTNHQDLPAGPLTKRLTNSVHRRETLLAALDEPGLTLPDLTARLLQPPLYSRRANSATVYSAIYRPAAGSVDYLWPGETRPQSFDRFEPGAYVHDFGALTA